MLDSAREIVNASTGQQVLAKTLGNFNSIVASHGQSVEAADDPVTIYLFPPCPETAKLFGRESAPNVAAVAVMHGEDHVLEAGVAGIGKSRETNALCSGKSKKFCRFPENRAEDLRTLAFLLAHCKNSAPDMLLTLGPWDELQTPDADGVSLFVYSKLLPPAPRNPRTSYSGPSSFQNSCASFTKINTRPI